MDNIFKDLNHCCLVYIDDILVFSKTIEQHKEDVLAVIERCIDHGIILGKNKCIYAEQEIEFLGLKIKGGQIILQKHILKNIENFPEKIEDRKQLERFLGCLTYTSNFIKDLAKIRKPLQQKLKKEVSWAWTTDDTKIIHNFKKMCKNLPILNFPNE